MTKKQDKAIRLQTYEIARSCAQPKNLLQPSRDLSSMIIVPNRFVRERLSRLASALYKKVVKSQNGFIISSH